MKKQSVLQIATIIGLSLPAAVQATEKWERITEPSELRALLSDRTIRDAGYLDVYRRDGIMANYYAAYDTVTIRKWDIKDDGRLCSYIFVKPDHLVECVAYSRSSEDRNRLRLEFDKGGDANSFTLVGTISDDPPPAKVYDAIVATAGQLD